MATLRLAYVNSFRDRHGRMRYYFRRGHTRVSLPGRPGEVEFMAAYQLAAAAFSPLQPLRSPDPAPGTFDALAVAYYRSPQFLSLSPASQKTYRHAIDNWREKHGAKRVTHLERRHVTEHLAAKFEASGPEAANKLRKVLKILCGFAVENGWRRNNPCDGVRKYKPAGEGFVAWSEGDVGKYLEHWPAGSRERLALLLLLYTGQRRSDVVRMGRQHVSGDTIRVVQQKTGAQLVIPLHPDLKSVLDELPRDNLTFLTTAYGKPFTVAGFGNWFRDACDGAGLTTRSAHGLRKSAAVRLVEAGCTSKQVAAITGHATLREIERYTAAADQERLAREAIRRLVLKRPANAK
mgnify:FL=1